MTDLTEMTATQTRMLGGAVDAGELDETAGEALHLLLSRTGCRWVVQTGRCEVVLDAGELIDEDAAPPVEWLPVSDRLRRFADAHGGAATLRLADGEDESAVCAQAGGSTAVIDVVVGSEPPQPWDFTPYASATLEGADLLTLLWSARWMPSGLDDPDYPMPPMWMRLADDQLTLHVDWTDFVPSRGTYRATALEQAGEATVAIPHQLLETFLRVVETTDDDLDAVAFTVEVGEVDRDGDLRGAMSVTGPGWRLTTWTVDTLRSRWATKVRDGLDTAAADVDGEVTEQSPIAWVVAVGGCAVHVALHHGHPDVVRISARLLEDVDERLELLRELGALNAAGDGVRFWWEDGAVVAAIDVRCTVLQLLPDAVRDVAAAFTQYAPLLAGLGATG